ncbi:MAG: beta-lactamase family protein [Myxococcales bacterium]|nr:beta-lactamase family protein [Myxococcales bacterium]
MWCCAACGGGGVEPVDSGAIDGGDGTDGAVGAWAEVDELVATRLAANGDPPAALVVYDADDQVVYRRGWNGFTTDQRVAVASASKLVSGLVLFEVIRTGVLSLDSTTGAVLGWTGPTAAITLRHLLSFTSGLAREHSCTLQAGITLAACVDAIAADPPTAAPGARFDYGSTHLQVAARMAEVRTGQSWNALYREVLADRLALPPEVTYFTAPRQAFGQLNPLVAGGLRASMDEYARALALAFHRGVTPALTIGTPELFDAQTSEPYPDAVIGVSPVANHGLPYHYGLTAWLECAPPASACSVLSSPGAFGFTPWLDRATGYYAILGMELDGTPGDGIVNFAVTLEQALRPLIAARVAGP